jgi:uncharacterized repeat protein (TIGR03803 family)
MLKSYRLRLHFSAATLPLLALTALTAGISPLSARAYSEKVLYSFPDQQAGETPNGTLARDKAGNLYGTTVGGGDSNAGTLFKLAPDGTFETLYNFCSLDGCADGEGSIPGPILIGKNLYGVTDGGGANGKGTIYSFSLKTRQLTTLYNFDWSYGVYPNGGLIADASGNLYGTTVNGGTAVNAQCNGAQGCGVVFEFSTTGTYSILYSFTGQNGDGANPIASLYRDAVGNLYGTTQYGGNTGCQSCGGGGTVFKLTPAGQETVLYDFPNGGPGPWSPWGGVTLDANGNLYGTTFWGGSTGCDGFGCGAVFEITASGQYQDLYEFNGNDGSNPEDGVLYRKGKLFGTTNGNGYDYGTVFEFDLAKAKLTTLYAFSNFPDGAQPGEGTLVRDKSGNFYGTTTYGGMDTCKNGQYAYPCGTVFELSPAKN